MRGIGALAAARGSLVALVALGSSWWPGDALSATKHVAPSPNAPFAYNTSGVVAIGADPASVAGPAVLQFQGVSAATFDPKSTQSINLGQFVVSPSMVANGMATTYNDTPFEIEVQAPEFNKVNTVPLLDKLLPTFGKRLSLKTVVENSLLLKGHLNGTVSGTGQANVVATVDTIKLGSMEVQSQDHATHYAFPIRFSQLKLPSSWVMAATTLPTSSTLSATSPTPAAQVLATGTPVSAAVVAPAPAAEMVTVATSLTPTPTPEPSTILLFGTAFAGLVLARRRRIAR